MYHVMFSCVKTQHPFEFKKLLGQSVSHSTPAWSSGHLGRGRRQIDFPAVGGPGGNRGTRDLDV